MAQTSKSPAVEVEVAGHPVRLSSPDKVCFPQRGYTKRDVFEYYLAVGDGIMRALDHRPTTLQRFPDGVEGEMFFQKRIATRGVPPWVESATITFPSGRTADELCPADLAHVAWAAQMGTIVFHPWPGWCMRSWTSWAGSATRRPRAAAACTCTSGSRRHTPSWRFGGRRSRWPVRWNVVAPTGSRPRGGRRNGASGFSWTTTRRRGTG